MTKNKILSLIPILLLFLLLTIDTAFSEEIKIGIEPNNFFTTLRAQSFSGKWQLQLFKKTATGTIIITEDIQTGEDAVLMLIPKGIIVRMSSLKNMDDGFDSARIVGGELLSLELPQLSPRILQGKLDITILNKEELSIINTININDYTISCASSEIITCEPEAAKAHIVAIETKIHYLKAHTKHPDEPFDVCDGKHCVVYPGTGSNRELIELLYPTINNHLLYYKDKLILPRYHHTCGGKISSAKDVYGLNNEPYHPSHSDLKDKKGSENCFHSPSFHWTLEIPIATIEDFLSLEFAGGASNVFIKSEPIKINDDGRILMVRILGRKVKELSGIEFLEHLHNFYGINSIKSMRYTIERLRRSMLVRGMGEGDGVGMCLYGADGLAKKGMNYKEILEFYFPGTNLK